MFRFVPVHIYVHLVHKKHVKGCTTTLDCLRVLYLVFYSIILNYRTFWLLPHQIVLKDMFSFDLNQMFLFYSHAVMSK